MITQILTISLLSLGIISGSGTSTASAFLDTPNKATEHENLAPFEINIGTGELVSSNTLNNTTTNKKAIVSRYDLPEHEHLAMHLRGNIYYQNTISYNEPNLQGTGTFDLDYTNVMLVYNITAYKYMTEASNKLNLRLNYDASSLITNNNDTKIISEILVSTEDWSTLLDQTPTRPDLTNYLYEQITNPAYGYNYQQTTNISTITATNSITSISTLNNEIILSGYKNNYVVMFLKIQRTSGTPIIYNNTNNLINLTANKISGYYLPDVENYEVIDLPALLLTIITMPFSFISMAFNITLFPGTPFQMNLSNLFLSIIAILIFIWLLKLVISVVGP